MQISNMTSAIEIAAGALLPGRRESRARVVAAGLTDADIDQLIKDAQRDVTLTNSDRTNIKRWSV